MFQRSGGLSGAFVRGRAGARYRPTLRRRRQSSRVDQRAARRSWREKPFTRAGALRTGDVGATPRGSGRLAACAARARHLLHRKCGKVGYSVPTAAIRSCSALRSAALSQGARLSADGRWAIKAVNAIGAQSRGAAHPRWPDVSHTGGTLWRSARAFLVSTGRAERYRKDQSRDDRRGYRGCAAPGQRRLSARSRFCLAVAPKALLRRINTLPNWPVSGLAWWLMSPEVDDTMLCNVAAVVAAWR